MSEIEEPKKPNVVVLDVHDSVIEWELVEGIMRQMAKDQKARGEELDRVAMERILGPGWEEVLKDG